MIGQIQLPYYNWKIINLNSLPIRSLVSSMRSLNQIISKVPTSNNIRKNSCSSRVPWHNLPPLGQVTAFLKTPWGQMVLTFQSERRDAEREGSGPGSVWPVRQPLTFLPTEAQFCAGWRCYCEPIPFARCFLSQPFLQEEMTMQPGPDWCGIESRCFCVLRWWKKQHRNKTKENSFTTASVFSSPPTFMVTMMHGIAAAI